MSDIVETMVGSLRASVRGPVLLPGDEGFEAECRGFNLALVQHPDVVVGASRVEDVVAAVRFATAAGLRVHVQATGHGAGIPAEGGLLVTTSRMMAISIDAQGRTARVSAGVRWQDVIDAAAPHGLAPLNGSSAGVSVVGYTLGGGMGPMGRNFGFAADHVLSIQVVTADARVLKVTAESEPELFWALRGGKCDIGIVTELEFELMTVSQFYGGGIYFAGESAGEVLHAFRGWVSTLPEESSASVALLRLPDLPEVPEPLRGRLSVHLRFLHVGTALESTALEDTARDGADLIAPMRAAATPILDLVALTPYSAIATLHNDPTEPMPAWDGSALLDELPAEAVDALLHVAGPGVDSPLVIVEIRQFGGALSRPAAVPNAVGGREAAFSVVVIGPYPPPLQKAVRAAGRNVLDAIQPWSTGSTQINFQGSATDPGSIRSAWAPEVADRLVAVKREWDPDGRFRFAYPLEAR